MIKMMKKKLCRSLSSILVAALVLTAGALLGAAPVHAARQDTLVAPQTGANAAKETFNSTEIFSDTPWKAVNSVWSNANGVYTWIPSAQFNNGTLAIKALPDGTMLYDFKVMRGSETEQKATVYSFAGIMQGKDATCVSEIIVDNKPVHLTFTLKDKVITVTQSGVIPVDISGTYRFLNAGKIHASKANVVALLEGLSPVLTSLNNWNRPYTLAIADEGTAAGDMLTVNAVHTPDQKLFACFKVASDLSKVYRVH